MHNAGQRVRYNRRVLRLCGAGMLLACRVCSGLLYDCKSERDVKTVKYKNTNRILIGSNSIILTVILIGCFVMIPTY